MTPNPPRSGTNASVGIPEIDREHREFLEICRRALNCRDGLSDDLFGVLKDLMDFTGYHFNTEASHMVRHNYPGFQEHAREHLAFSKKVGEFLDDFEKGKPGLAGDICSYLNHWARTHLMGTDQDMGRFLLRARNTAAILKRSRSAGAFAG